MGAIVAVVLNLAFWLCMYSVQNWEVKRGRIPSRQPHNQKRPWDGFLHLQDYYTTLWGDLAGLSLIDEVVGREIQAGIPAWWQVLACLAAGVGLGLYFHFKEWMSSWHKPDSAYPWKGRVSWMGRLHVAYFSLQVTVVLGAVWFWVSGNLTFFEALVGFAGGALFLAAVFLDIKSKRWTKTPVQHG